LAARRACTAVKQRVTLVFTPSSVNVFTARSPSGMSGTFTTTCVPYFTYARPSDSIPS
jgi:hypothetical protein